MTRWGRSIGATILLLAGAAAAALPSDYVPIAYIQTKGITWNCYPMINTEFVPNPQTDRIEAQVSFVSVANAQAIWCARNQSPSDSTWTLFLMPGGLLRPDYGVSSAPPTVGACTPFETETVYTCTVSNGSFRVGNGASFDFAAVSTFTNTVGPLVFFTAYTNDPAKAKCRYASNNARLHGLKIWRNGELVRDYALFRQGDTPHLWDRVTETEAILRDCLTGPDCATNLAVQAQDAFIAGTNAVTPDLSVVDTTTGRTLMPGADYAVTWSRNETHGTALAHVRVRYGSGTFGERDVPVTLRRDVPAGCTPLAYIEGDGHSWLLTDYMPNPQTDTLRLDYAFTRIETTALTCARDNKDRNTWSVCLIKENYRFDYSTPREPTAHTGRLVVGAPYTFTLSNAALTLNDGNAITLAANANLTNTGNPLQFYAFYVGGPDSGTRNTVSYHRTYRCQVWRSGALIHDWAPVRTAEGVVTLADTVTGTILTPRTDGTAGAGFLAGPSLTRPFATAAVPLQTWDGVNAVTPALSVRDAASGAVLAAGTDYTVTYASNTVPGTATATVAGLAAYAGATSVVPFAIARAVPSEYEPLEYLQGANKAYFLTDFTPNPSTDRIEMNLELTETGIDASPFCARKDYVSSYTVFLLKSGGMRFDYYNTTRCQVTPDIALVAGRRYLLRYAGPLFDFGDEVHGGYRPQDGFSQTGSALHLFVDTGKNFYSTHRLFDCSVWRGGVPLRLWVPVKRVSDGVVTLYDRMQGTVLTPSGGSFVAGPKKADFTVSVRHQPWAEGTRFRPALAVTNTLTGAELVRGGDYAASFVTNPVARFGVVTATGRAGTAYADQAQSRDFSLYPALPAGYERLDYIQGDGQTAFLTDITPAPLQDRILAFFTPTDSTPQGLFCARGTNGFDRTWSFSTVREPFTFRSRFDFGCSNITFGVVLRPFERVCCSVRQNQAALGSGDAQTIGGSLSEAGGPLAILGFYYKQGETPVFSSYSTLRLHAFQYWRNDVLTLDLVPVRTSAGVVTLFDYVSGAALEPTGTGSFRAGPVWDVDPPPPAGLMLIIR